MRDDHRARGLQSQVQGKAQDTRGVPGKVGCAAKGKGRYHGRRATPSRFRLATWTRRDVYQPVCPSNNRVAVSRFRIA